MYTQKRDIRNDINIIVRVFQVNVSKKGSKIVLMWRMDEAKDIEKARKYFKKLTIQGWIATKLNGEQRRILEFKPEYEKLLLIPISEGG